jgi:hypothetical protein
MHFKLVDEKPKTFVLVFETDDELAGTLKSSQVGRTRANRKPGTP